VVTVGCDVVVLVFVVIGLLPYSCGHLKIEISVTSAVEVYHHWIMLRFVSDRTTLIVSSATVFSLNVYSSHPCCLSLPRQNLNVDESLLCVIRVQEVIVGVQERPRLCLRMFQGSAQQNHFMEFQ
jgi:hypothetical protein